MTWQWTGMRSNPNCRILTGYKDPTRSRRSRPKGAPAYPGNRNIQDTSEERKSTETPLLVASERGQAISVKPATPELRQPQPAAAKERPQIELRLCAEQERWEGYLGSWHPGPGRPPCQNPDLLAKVVCGLASFCRELVQQKVCPVEAGGSAFGRPGESINNSLE